jgi:hypothetical protein
MPSSTSNSSSLESCNSLVELKFKNRRCKKCVKKAAVKISKIEAIKNKLLYRCDDWSRDNNFIDWCKYINEIKIIVIGGGCSHDVERNWMN